MFIDSESGNVVVLSSAFVAGEKQRRETKKEREKNKKLFDKWIEARPRKKNVKTERSQ